VARQVEWRKLWATLLPPSDRRDINGRPAAFSFIRLAAAKRAAQAHDLVTTLEVCSRERLDATRDDCRQIESRIEAGAV
jgi:hypothetical protein